MNTPQAFVLATQLHQAGRLAKAEALYRDILTADPDHVEARHRLGIVANQMGRLEEAVALLQQTVLLAPQNAVAHYHLGQALAAAGRLDDAAASFRRALQLQPSAGQIYSDLGITLAGLNQLDEAVIAFQRAAALAPKSAAALGNLGNALRMQGRFEEAVAACREALRIDPGSAESCNNLAVALSAQGHLPESIAVLQRALELKPHYAEAHNNLGTAFFQQQQPAAAVDEFRRALEAKPAFPEAATNLGVALLELGHIADSIEAHHRALQLAPNYPDAHHYLGNALRQAGQLEPAMAAYRQALTLRPNWPEALGNAGTALALMGRHDLAMETYQRALQLRPDCPEVYYHLGDMLHEQGRSDEAMAALQRAIELRPHYAEACVSHGNTLKDLGRIEEAAAAYRRALEIKPGDALTHSNLVFARQFHPEWDDPMLAAEQRCWSEKFAAPLQQHIQPWKNDPNPERRLRIGYVSPDFRFQAEIFFVLPLLEAHDHREFEIHCYASVARPDSMTGRIRSQADAWHDVLCLSHEQLAEKIRRDRIDILIDLTMHTGRNRLPVFACKPAPVQVTWLAYPGSTGLAAIDYRITDPRLDPPAVTNPYYTEEALSLPDAWVCYHPLSDGPPVNPLPASAKPKTPLTFGCLNNFCKTNPPTLTLFGEVLKAVPSSRLLLRAPEGSARERILEHFGAQGVSHERISFAGTVSRIDYLALYHQIDIALDTLPYNGITTTCDALWMGVPVITLAGKTAAGRAGVCLLSTVGLPEFVTTTPEEFVQTARRLSKSRPRLAKLRASLRARMEASPLMDATRFARHLETAYRTIWRRWCAGETPAEQ